MTLSHQEEAEIRSVTRFKKKGKAYEIFKVIFFKIMVKMYILDLKS